MADAVICVDGGVTRENFRDMEINILKRFHGASPSLASQSLASNVYIPEDISKDIKMGRRSSYTQGIDG